MRWLRSWGRLSGSGGNADSIVRLIEMQFSLEKKFFEKSLLKEVCFVYKIRHLLINSADFFIVDGIFFHGYSRSNTLATRPS